MITWVCVQKQNGSSAADKPSTTAPGTGKGKKAEPKGSIASMFAQTGQKSDAEAARKKETARKEETKEVWRQ